MFRASSSPSCNASVFRLSLLSSAAHLALLLVLGLALGAQAAHAQTAVFSGTQGLNFGTTALGSTGPAQTLTFTFTNATAAIIDAPIALTQGACSSTNPACPNPTSNALDFAVASGGTCDTTTDYGTGATTSCTVNVTFTPTAPGQRNGALDLMSSSGAVIATAYIYGTGTGPMVGFPPATIETVAGNGINGDCCDNGPATSASVIPADVAVDGAGNFYIVDSTVDRIRKVTPSGTITTVAGGTAGRGGDGGPATSAQLFEPEGIAVDGAGNLYIADSGNNKIREVNLSGTITTVAGNGIQGYSGDGGPAAAAELQFPEKVAVDSVGNLYISDSRNGVVRKVTLSGTITTVAGNGTLGFSGDNGPATSAELAGPGGLVVDGSGNLYITDGGNARIRKVDSSGTITTVAGNGTQGFGGDNGPATSATLHEPASIAVDGVGNLYIADTVNNRIREVDPSGTITTVAGNGSATFSGDNGVAASAALIYPFGVAVDSAGNLYVADFGNDRIRKVNISGANLIFATTNVGFISTPASVEVANIGNGPLTIESDPALSWNFGLVSNTCTSGAPIPAGGSCNIAADFEPTEFGNPLTGSLTLTDNAFSAAGYATQTINLTGTTPVPPPAISAVTPSAGSPCGGTVVTIYGSDLSGATSVTFGGTPATSFTVISNTRIVATTPAGTLGGAVDIDVKTSQGNSAISATDKFQYANPLTAAVAIPSETLAAVTAANFTPVTAADGVPAYSYAITSGTLPTGLSINSSTGAISGTPAAPAANASYTVTATDAAGETASASFTLTVSQAAQSISFTQPASPLGYGIGPISMSATAISGLPVAFTVISGPGTISGSTLTVTGPGTIVIAANQPGNTIYTAAAQVTRTITVNNSTLNIIADNASRIYGTANPAFIGTVTGQQNGDTFTESFATSATQSSPAGTYAIVPNASGTNLSNYTVSAFNGALTVTQAASSVSLNASTGSITPGQSLMLTATATDATPGSTGAPTGTVAFFDGTTQLGAGTLTNGVASLGVNSLAPGTSHSFTATYAGDTNFTGSSVSAPLAITVDGSPDFLLGAPGSVNLSATPGGKVTTSFNVAPLYGSYAGSVIFSVTGLPSGATASFSPASIPANTTTPQTVTLSIQLPQSAASTKDSQPWRNTAPVAFGLLLLPFATMRRTMRRLRKSLSGRTTMLVLLLAAGLAGMASLSGCGSSDTPKAAATQAYTVTVTANAGALMHSFQIDLNVQ